MISDQSLNLSCSAQARFGHISLPDDRKQQDSIMKFLVKVAKHTINTSTKSRDEKMFSLAAMMIERSKSIESPSAVVQLKMWFEKIFGDLWRPR